MRRTRALLVLLIATISLLPLNPQNCWAAYEPSGSGFPLMGGIEIASPRNTTYSTGLLTLNASVRSMAGPTYNYQFVYSIDGQENASLHLSSKFVPVEANVRYANGTTEKRVSQIFSYYVFSGLTALPELAHGKHNLTVYGIYERAGSNTNWPALLWDKQSVNFTVNLNQTPKIQNLTIENKTYNQTSLPLNFTLDSLAAWTGYSLDRAANITLLGNTTLTGLSFGSHLLTVYANDTLGNMGKAEVAFEVEQQTPQYGVIEATVGVLAAGLIVVTGLIFKKRKKP